MVYLQEAGPLVKPLAPCQQCEPNDILYLLHTYFTDDRAACARRHYVMLFSRLKYACPGTATVIRRVSEPELPEPSL